MKKLLKVLIIDDSETDAELIMREFKHSEYTPEFKRVDTEEEMKNALNNFAWDVILSDYQMPGFSGLEALNIYKESGLGIPFIIISGAIGDDLAVDIVKKGASDYVLKDNLKRLFVVIERETRELGIKREYRKQLEQKIKEGDLKGEDLKILQEIKDLVIEQVMELNKQNEALKTLRKQNKILIIENEVLKGEIIKNRVEKLQS